MTAPDPAAIAKGLTANMRAALTDATTGNGYHLRLVCNRLYPPTINGLERRDLVNSWGTLTPLGLAVRAHLENSHD